MRKRNDNSSTFIILCSIDLCTYSNCRRRNHKRRFPSVSAVSFEWVFTFQAEKVQPPFVLINSGAKNILLALQVCLFKCFWEAGDFTLQDMYFRYTKHVQLPMTATSSTDRKLHLYFLLPPPVFGCMCHFCWIVCGSTHGLWHYLIEKQISQSQKTSFCGTLQIYNSKNSTLERLVNSFNGKSPAPQKHEDFIFSATLTKIV